jgi:predicted nucleic acid-binding protein
VAVLIDTDVLVELERGGDQGPLDEAVGEQDRAISVITVSELLHGVYRATGARRAQRSAFVEHLLAGMQAIAITEPIARVHAEIWSQLAQDGNMIGAHDLWIAATAIAHGYGVATHNQADFERVPGLDVITISSEDPQPPPSTNAS